jgi:hypothetical protein
VARPHGERGNRAPGGEGGGAKSWLAVKIKLERRRFWGADNNAGLYLSRDDVDVDVLQVVDNVSQEAWAICGLDNNFCVGAVSVGLDFY